MLIQLFVAAMIGALVAFIMGSLATRDKRLHLTYMAVGAIGAVAYACRPLFYGEDYVNLNYRNIVIIAAVASGLAILFLTRRKR